MTTEITLKDDNRIVYHVSLESLDREDLEYLKNAIEQATGDIRGKLREEPLYEDSDGF